MSTNTVLDDAGQRVGAAKAAAQTRQKEIIESMREEIGRQHYQRANLELPKLEQFITKHARPYLEHLTRLSQHAPAPLPSGILVYVRELESLCLSGTDWVQSAISEWDRLAPPFEANTQRLHLARRTTEVASIRTRLMNWEGKESRMRVLMTLIDTYVEQSHWPASPPPAAA